MDVAITKFQTTNRAFTLLDAPGHRDFIPNMISGAAQADVALLVVDSSPGEFESGFDLGGQTREHALLCRSLGVQQVAVVINKLDGIQWSQSRYDEISSKLIVFLQQAGFKKPKIAFIPCSGLMGENILERKSPELSAWYSGPTLVEHIDQFELPSRAIDRPFRMSITDIFKGGVGAGGSSGAITVGGRIEQGAVQVGDPVMAMPLMNEIAQVKGATNLSPIFRGISD